MKECNAFIRMRIYLFGEYNGPLSADYDHVEILQFPENKDIKTAISFIPAYFSSVYSENESERNEMEFMFLHAYMRPSGYDLNSYVPDIELKELIGDMRNFGYAQEDINDFVTCYIKEMMSYDQIFESSMHLLLFGKHMSGVSVNISGKPDLKDAISFIPQYLDFITTTYSKHYLCEGTANLDEILHGFILRMKEENYTTKDQQLFAASWFKAMEQQEKMSLAFMFVCLFGRFEYKDWRGETNLLLPEIRNFELALSIIPEYIDYVKFYDDPSYNDSASPSPEKIIECIFLPLMSEQGYSKKETEIFRARFLDEANRNIIDERIVINNGDEFWF